MLRSFMTIAALCTAMGCSAGPSERMPASTSETYIGSWRSITPSTEFIRLTVTEWSSSSRSGDLGAQLALSGVRWEGSGRIEGDSLVMQLSLPAASTTRSVLVAHTTDGRTLLVQWRADAGAPTALTFVRE